MDERVDSAAVALLRFAGGAVGTLAYGESEDPVYRYRVAPWVVRPR